MNDSVERKTIYLDDALEAIRKLPNAGMHWFVSAEAVFDVLSKLPSTQSEPQWIPVTERMPNEDYSTDWKVQHSGPVLVTVVDGEDVFVDMYSTVNGAWPLLHKVTAWMPLPKPYEACKKGNTNEELNLS